MSAPSVTMPHLDRARRGVAATFTYKTELELNDICGALAELAGCEVASQVPVPGGRVDLVITLGTFRHVFEIKLKIDTKGSARLAAAQAHGYASSLNAAAYVIAPKINWKSVWAISDAFPDVRFVDVEEFEGITRLLGSEAAIRGRAMRHADAAALLLERLDDDGDPRGARHASARYAKHLLAMIDQIPGAAS